MVQKKFKISCSRDLKATQAQLAALDSVVSISPVLDIRDLDIYATLQAEDESALNVIVEQIRIIEPIVAINEVIE